MPITLLSWPVRGRNQTGSRTVPQPYLNDEQWLLIADLFPEPPRTRVGGRPRVKPRKCLEGVLWVLRTGARWKDLPRQYPSPSTCWRRFKKWTESGVFLKIWKKLLQQLDDFRDINWEEAIADGTFSPAKKGGDEVGNTKKGKGTKIMLMIDGNGTPLSVTTASANEAEVNLIEPMIEQRTLDTKPAHLMYDRAADSDPLRKRLAAQQIDLICDHRKNRRKPPTQDGRKARRLSRRYKVERTISWLFNNRRLVVRYERYAHLFLGFAQLACVYTIIQWF